MKSNAPCLCEGKIALEFSQTTKSWIHRKSKTVHKIRRCQTGEWHKPCPNVSIHDFMQSTGRSACFSKRSLIVRVELAVISQSATRWKLRRSWQQLNFEEHTVHYKCTLTGMIAQKLSLLSKKTTQLNPFLKGRPCVRIENRKSKKMLMESGRPRLSKKTYVQAHLTDDITECICKKRSGNSFARHEAPNRVKRRGQPFLRRL